MASNGMDVLELSGNLDDNDIDIRRALDERLVPASIKDSVEGQIQAGRLSLEDITDKIIGVLDGLNDEDKVECIEEYSRRDLAKVVNRGALLYNIAQQKIKEAEKRILIKNVTGFDESVLQKIVKKTGYGFESLPTHRRYGPPPDMDPNDVPRGCEIYVGRIPRNIFEDSLIPLFSEIGKIWDLRYMLNPADGTGRGYCFVQYCDRDDAIKAVSRLDDYEIVGGCRLSVSLSRAHTTLFLGNIPKYKDTSEIQAELDSLVDNVSKVTVYPPADPSDTRKNRGYCFVHFDTQRSASVAKKKLGCPKVRLYNRAITVEWADERSDDQAQSKVKTLHIKGISEFINEDDIRDAFLPYGDVECVKKVSDYAFITFSKREQAENALDTMQNERIGGRSIQIAFARPWTAKRRSYRPSRSPVHSHSIVRRRERSRSYRRHHGRAIRSPSNCSSYNIDRKRRHVPPSLGRLASQLDYYLAADVYSAPNSGWSRNSHHYKQPSYSGYR